MKSITKEVVWYNVYIYIYLYKERKKEREREKKIRTYIYSRFIPPIHFAGGQASRVKLIQERFRCP